MRKCLSARADRSSKDGQVRRNTLTDGAGLRGTRPKGRTIVRRHRTAVRQPQMDIKGLRRGIDIVHNQQVVLSARQTTYLRTYRALVDLAALPTDDSHRRFLQLAAGAYGWMPRVVRMGPRPLGPCRSRTGRCVSRQPGGSSRIGRQAHRCVSLLGRRCIKGSSFRES